MLRTVTNFDIDILNVGNKTQKIKNHFQNENVKTRPELFISFFFFFVGEADHAHGAASVAASPKQLFASSKIAHLEPLINFKIVSATDSKYHTRAVNEGGERIRDGHIQPFADKMHLQFDLYGETFSHQLELTTDFIEPNSKITLHKEGNQKQKKNKNQCSKTILCHCCYIEIHCTNIYFIFIIFLYFHFIRWHH
jgi:hypothetical protein